MRLIKRAASYPAVERIFVHPAIKKALCEDTAKDTDRAWLSKVRPMWGHHYHFHIRIVCPAGSTNCEHQPAPGQRRWLRRRGGSLDRPDQAAGKAGRPAAAAQARPHDRSAAGGVQGRAGQRGRPGLGLGRGARQAPAEKAKAPVPKKSADAAKKTTEKK